ncbi:polysaccharide biosynthesis C-terminal domain-containing protein, partial [candidate division KSB1 bacterium]|nr:polysaccharide biosynthesis C-terminal domain-containing protein [candidate division KSB1 bacterium]
FSKDYFRKMLHFGLPFVPSILGAALMVSLDRIFLEKYWGQATVGLYGAGSRLAMLIGLLIKAFQFAWEPFLTATYQQADAPRLYSKIFTYFVGILGVIYLGITLLVNELVRLKFGNYTFFGPEYYASTTVVPLLMLGAVAYGIYLHFTIGIYVQRKSIFFPVVTAFGAIISLGANWLLIPTYGMLGAAWANVLAFGGMMLVMFGLNQKYFPIPYEFLRLGKLILVLASTGLAPVLFGGLNAPGLKLGLWLLIPLWLGLLNFYEKTEFRQLKSYLKGKVWLNSRW